jgi:hypothetical protein
MQSHRNLLMIRSARLVSAQGQRLRLRSATLLVTITLLYLIWPIQFARSHAITRSECSEGSDFIRNAALSRDNGQSRADYLDHLRGDLQTIRAFPPELRWFAQDEDDEALLISAATDVFDDPHPPDEHRRAFLERCLSSPSGNS